jgi:hypothetical protein
MSPSDRELPIKFKTFFAEKIISSRTGASCPNQSAGIPLFVLPKSVFETTARDYRIALRDLPK